MSKIIFRLQDVLSERGMSRAELAHASGITRQSIDKLCNSPKAIRLETLAKLCDTLDLYDTRLFLIVDDD